MNNTQKGSTTLMVVMSLTALFGFAALAVDLGYMQMKKSDLQNAADAGALVGATALLSLGEQPQVIRESIMSIAKKNLTETDSPNLAVMAEDIVFMRDGIIDEQNPNQVKVTVRRSSQRGNPVNLFFGPAIDTQTAEVEATATAGIVATCSSKCLLPVMVPTKFTWNDYVEDKKSKYYDNGQLDIDSQLEMSTLNVQGYSDSDVGMSITLKVGNPQEAMVPSHYNAVDLPPVNKGNPVPGANAYRENWYSCEGSNNVLVEIGDEMQLEPGNMVGPTKQGVSTLIGRDPTAVWDTTTNSIAMSAYSDPMESPRIGIVAFYDPRYPPANGRTTLKVFQLGAVFVSSISGNGMVSARFIHAMAKYPEDTGQSNCLLYKARILN